MKRYLIAALVVAACAHIERPQSTPTMIGDWGHGTPTVAEIHECQDLDGGEMIYNPDTNTWTCESN